jgi:hypothetical protein
MGQSIFLLPGDLVATGIFTLIHQRNTLVEYVLEEGLVSMLTFPLLSASTIVIAFLLLLELEFSLLPALYGAITLFFGTTFLHYSQVHQENSQLIFLVLASYYMHLLWLRQKRILPLVIGAALLGCSLLFRLTTAADIVSETLFILLLLTWRSSKFKDLYTSFKTNFKTICTFLLVQFFVCTIFFSIDRLYQYKRFGEWTTTYIDVFARQVRQQMLAASAYIDPKWPFNLDRLTGLSNVLFSPEKSLFIYDPLLLVLLGVVVLRHFKLGTGRLNYIRRAYLVAGIVCLGLYLYGYSNVIFWGGDSSWSARYHTNPVQMLCLLAVPLFVEKFADLKKIWQWLITTLIGLALFIQLMSIIFPYPLEVVQQGCGGTSFRLGQRVLNLVAFLTGGIKINPQCTALNSPQFEAPYFWSFLDYTTQSFSPITNMIIGISWLLLAIWAIQKFITLLRMTKKIVTTTLEKGQIDATS